MPNTSNRPDATIEKLLEDRSQFEQWLTRLDEAGAPDAVRARVRADYEARLSAVMEQLKSHGATIASELERHENEQAELVNREAAELETLAEAEVRHAVGEYEDPQWNRINNAQQKALSDVRTRLERVRGEIARLSEVHRLIATRPAAPAPAPARVPAPVRAAEPIRSAPPAAEPTAASASAFAPPSEVTTPRFVPKPPQSAPARPSGDELDFIKSVNVEQAASLSPAAAERQRNSGAQPVVTTSTPPPEPSTQPPPAPRTPSTPSGANKTLKCGDCGTLNRATEWYCERCGAELAAM